MAKLQTLIRHKKWQLDEKRRVLAQMEAKREAIVARIAALDAQAREEARHAGAGIALVTMGDYMAGVKLRRAAMDEEIAAVDKDLIAVREEIREAFQELKTYEIAEEARQKRIADKQAKLEQSQLDEMGAQNYFQEQKKD